MSQDQEPVVITEPLVRAPFTPEQVDSMNAYQASGAFHPFTCPDHYIRQGDRIDHVSLRATESGWTCSEACGYTQDWVHAWVADGSWRQARAVAEQYFPPPAE